MDKKTMVEQTLTKEMIESGKTLLSKLDDSNIQPDAAFWFYFPDIQEWKLILAEVQVGQQGPKKVYRKIQNIILKFSNELGELSLSHITLTRPDSPLIKLLRTAIRTGTGTGIRFKNNVINGTVIEDAYIYRIL